MENVPPPSNKLALPRKLATIKNFELRKNAKLVTRFFLVTFMGRSSPNNLSEVQTLQNIPHPKIELLATHVNLVPTNFT